MFGCFGRSDTTNLHAPVFEQLVDLSLIGLGIDCAVSDVANGEALQNQRSNRFVVLEQVKRQVQLVRPALINKR